MKFAILLALLGFAAMQLAEGRSYSYKFYYRTPTWSRRSSSSSSSSSSRGSSGSSSRVKSSSYSYFKKSSVDMAKYYYALGQAKLRLAVTSTSENFCNRAQTCEDNDNNCQTINEFQEKVCSEGGLIYYIMRRTLRPSLISQTDCKVVRLVQCPSWNVQMVCSARDYLLRKYCSKYESEEEEEGEGEDEQQQVEEAPAKPQAAKSETVVQAVPETQPRLLEDEAPPAKPAETSPTTAAPAPRSYTTAPPLF